jgi:hypothetical protein
LTGGDFIVSDERMIRGLSTLLVLLIAAPSMAAAETMSFGDAAASLAKSCGADIAANCRGVNLDSGRLKECLSRNQDVTSARCKANYLASFDAIQKRIAARVTVASSCRLEIIKLCAGSTKETRKSIPCLMTVKGVGKNCNQALTDAGYR